MGYCDAEDSLHNLLPTILSLHEKDYLNQSCHQCSLWNNNPFRLLIVELVHIITYPTRASKDVGELFTIREKLFAGFIITRRAILTALRVILSTIFITPGSRHVTTINQIRCLFAGVVVSLQDASQPLRIDPSQ